MDSNFLSLPNDNGENLSSGVNVPFPIHKSVVEGDCDKISSLIDEGYDVNACDENDRTPLLLAVIHRQHEVLKLLLSSNAKTELNDFDGMSPFVTAVINHDEDATQILLDYNCDPDKLDDFLRYPLYFACVDGLTSVIEKFVAAKCNLEYCINGITPLGMICSSDHKKSLDLLLTGGADPNFRGDSALAPIHHACIHGNPGCVEILLEHGAYVDCTDVSGRTALAFACENDRYHCAKLLIENGASLYAYNFKIESSPIHLAARQTISLCLGLLIKSDVDVDYVCEGATPLDEAVSVKNLQGCKMLLSKGADPNYVPSKDKNNLLMDAAERNSVEIIKELVSNGASVNQVTYSSPLIVAANYKSWDAFDLLLSYNVDVNYVDAQGNSALSTLCYVATVDYEQQYKSCRNLLTAGGNISHLIEASKRSEYADMENMLACIRPGLILLLVEFSTSVEHIQFLSKHSQNEHYRRFYDEDELTKVDQYINQPRQLRHLCRVTIKCTLGPKGLRLMEELTLPTSLKNYLKHC